MWPHDRRRDEIVVGGWRGLFGERKPEEIKRANLRYRFLTYGWQWWVICTNF
jgi:hypothetical protein